MTEPNDQISLDAAIQRTIAQYQSYDLLTRSDFIFQQAKDDLENIRKLNPEEVRQVIAGYESSAIPFEPYVHGLPETNRLRTVGELLGRFISLCDEKASGARIWNPERNFIAKAGVRQPIWLKHILRYIESKGDSSNLSTGVGNIIRYLERPSEEVPISDNRTRQFISEHILKNAHIPAAFPGNLIAFFRQYGLHTANPDNFTIAVNWMLFGELVSFWRGTPKFWRLGTSENGKSVWPEMRDNQIASIGWNDLGDLDQAGLTKVVIQTTLASKGYNDPKNVLSRKAGEIFDFVDADPQDIIVAADGQQIKGIGRISGHYNYDPDMPTFFHTRPVEWLITDVDLPVLEEGLRTSFVELKQPSSRDLIRSILENKPMTTNTSRPASAISLNTILYGPPGSGKTYSTIDLAVTIIDGESAGNHADNKKRFDQLRAQGLIEFITFHQNYSYEDFVTGLRPEPDASTLKFERVPGIFMEIATRARANWERSKASSTAEPVINEPSFEDVFYSFFEKLIEEEVPEVEIKMRSKSFRITRIDLEDQHIKFTKNSGGTGHDLVISIVKGIYEGSRNYRQDGLGIYYFPLVEALKEHSRQIKKPVQVEPSLKYVLIIDEINRANISRVLGELITLLEDDKRLGAENELRVTLPGGIRDFGVPPNLYIIGTMNTADKSIALVDIALRRRFEFVGMYPTSDVLGQLVREGHISESGQALLQKLNEGIFEKKKTADFLIGHAYLIGKTQDKQIEDVIRRKIIPLLMEYFSGRTDEVANLFEGSRWNVRYDASRYDWEIKPV